METNKNDSKQLWLAAVMFFNIMVKNFLKNNDKEFSQEEKVFIQSYIQYGYLSVISGGVTIGLVILYYFYPSTILYWIHTLSILTTIIVIVVWSIGVLSWSILYHKQWVQYGSIGVGRDKIILYFIPLYNIVARYSIHQFNQPNLWIKESLLRRTIWAILWLIQTQILLVFRTILIIIRVVTIAADIDLVQEKKNTILEYVFTINPEEIRSYMIASIDFVSQKIQQKIIQPSWKELVQAYQKTYSHLHPIDTTITIQYIIGFAMFSIIARNIYKDGNTLLFIPLLIIVGRYVIMYRKRKHLPALPVAREIQWLLIKFYQTIIKK